MTTILSDQSIMTSQSGRAEQESLWLPTRDAETATGWTLKPEGFCKDDICLPIPPSRANEFVAETDERCSCQAGRRGWPHRRRKQDGDVRRPD